MSSIHAPEDSHPCQCFTRCLTTQSHRTPFAAELLGSAVRRLPSDPLLHRFCITMFCRSKKRTARYANTFCAARDRRSHTPIASVAWMASLCCSYFSTFPSSVSALISTRPHARSWTLLTQPPRLRRPRESVDSKDGAVCVVLLDLLGLDSLLQSIACPARRADWTSGGLRRVRPQGVGNGDAETSRTIEDLPSSLAWDGSPTPVVSYDIRHTCLGTPFRVVSVSFPCPLPCLDVWAES